MNYTAKRTKERTEIGDDAFIGSDSLLRAPLKIGKGAVTGGGSVVTKDVPDGMVAVGVPARAIKRAEPPAQEPTKSKAPSEKRA
jgi:bifunctional UDP-N-acetylglucosamine pyrophosphorylase/glucosamine-1-phosphate N-acetyltransferase